MMEQQEHIREHGVEGAIRAEAVLGKLRNAAGQLRNVVLGPDDVDALVAHLDAVAEGRRHR